MDQKMEENVEEKMYVVVSKDMKENQFLLTWALQNSGGKQLCTVHVHVPSPKGFKMTDNYWDKLKYTSSGSDPLYHHPSKEFDVKEDHAQLSAAIDKFLHSSHNSAVQIEKLFFEANSVHGGIKQFVEKHRIRNLVIGVEGETQYPLKSSLGSRKGKSVKTNALAYCHIWFVCKGRLVDTREAINQPHLSCDKKVLVSAARNKIAGPVTAPGELLSSRRSTDSNDASASKSVPLCNSSAGRISLPSLGIDSAKKSQPVDSEESSRHEIAENKGLADAVTRAKKAEKLNRKELRPRKAKEEELKKTSDELSMIVAQKCSLEESNFSLKESEKKLLSAAELLVLTISFLNKQVSPIKHNKSISIQSSPTIKAN